MKTLSRHLKNEKGMATIETIPLIMVFVVMICYEFGVFGVIHTGIMQSMSARAYAFETFRNRTNLVYFRDDPDSVDKVQFHDVGNRVHGIASELRDKAVDPEDGVASERPLRMGIPMAPIQLSRSETNHNDKIFDTSHVGVAKRNTDVDASPVWIQVHYGICLNAKCGG